MYNNSYSNRSKRPQAEPEKPQSQYQWRTRVNTLMNTSDEPRASKLTNSSRHFSDSSSDKSRSHDKLMSASKWMDKDDKVTGRAISWREKLRRERFSRTKSEDQLKIRGVRFLSEDLPTTSKSLDGDDEDETTLSGRLSSRSKRHYRPEWGDDDGNKDSLSRGKYDETDSADNDDNEYGACGGSFDSGLDLRISCSPDERGYDQNERTSSRSRSRSSGSNESLRSKSQVKSSIPPLGSSSVSCSVPIPGIPVGDLSGCGAISKRPRDRTRTQDIIDSETRPIPRDRDVWDELEEQTRTHAQTKQSDECLYNQSYPPHSNYYSDFQTYGSGRQTKSIRESRIETELENELKTAMKSNEIPGFSFFSNNDDYMEDIIQNIIDTEEKQAEDNTEELKRLNEALMFSDENYVHDTMVDNRKADSADANSDEFEYSLTKDTHDFYSMIPRKRSSSLPSRIEDNEDDITILLFRSWKLKTRKQDEEEEKLSSREGKEDEWACVPSVFLEDVFTFLSPKERHQASQVCRHWYDLFYSPRVWETFILLEKTLTKKRFNLYKGYQRELCPWKAQICLKRVGSFFKKIVITPISDYFNLCEFLRVLTAFLEYQVNQGETSMPLLHTFDFTFACATRSSEGLFVHGTGGQILDMIVKLLTQMSGLKHLKVNQLLTDIEEVPEVFKALTEGFCECLSSLEMLNVTKLPYAITELAQFRNLIKLTVSPQHINDEVVVLLAGINLLYLHLLQDVYTCDCLPVHYEVWKLVKEMAPWLKVYLEVSGATRSRLVIQPRAPVYGIFFRTPYSRLTNYLISDIVEHYSKTLKYLVQEQLPRIHGPRGFDNRCDSSLLFLIRRCQRLHTLVISERISTSTLILLATEGKTLSSLLVRQNGLIKRCDWSQCGEWSREFYARLRENALNYEKCTYEICRILKRRWRPLSDKQFMRLRNVPQVEMS